MRKQINIFILLLTFSNLNAQTDEQIINKILFDLFGFQQDTILIKNIKTKTYFEYDSVSFENMTGLTVPSKIISEWKNNEEAQDYSAEWNEQELNKIDTLYLENDTVIVKKPVFKCLSKDKIDQLFEMTKKREKIYSISKILLDNSKENAIFHFIIIPWPGDFYSETVLIKKVFGKWKIIERFDFTMT
tara:strand:- start:80 stop:643 length:564 start_codon:yes stop_codon:yes gene_type:complete